MRVPRKWGGRPEMELVTDGAVKQTRPRTASTGIRTAKTRTCTRSYVKGHCVPLCVCVVWCAWRRNLLLHRLVWRGIMGVKKAMNAV